jgi:hypothetical protein
MSEAVHQRTLELLWMALKEIVRLRAELARSTLNQDDSHG